MIRPLLRFSLATVLLVAGLSLVTAQEADFRNLLRPPETPVEYWQAIKFELDVGRADLAATFLRGLLSRNLSDKDLLAIADKDGITEILKLRNVPQWSRIKKEDAQAKKDAEDLIGRVLQAVRKRQEDPVRIRELIGQLKATPEERIYATTELIRLGAGVVPYLLDAYLKATAAGDRLVILQALRRIGQPGLEPLLAALDTDNELLKLDLLDILMKQYTASGRLIVPHLWYLSAARSESEAVRQRAVQLLARWLNKDASRLPSAKVELTREAERYYNHQVSLGDKNAVSVWRWDDGKLVQGWPGRPQVSAAEAEEYFGLRFARQALTLDPAYTPAQVVFLSLAIDKALTRSGLAVPLTKASPQVAELLARSNSETVIEMTEKAIKEKRTSVVLAGVQALADRAEIRARRPLTRGEPVLVQALYYPEPRVQMAAAEGLLRMPGAMAPKTSARIVEILARALSPAGAYIPGRKVLVAGSDETWREKIRLAALAAGVQPVLVSNTNEAMRQLHASGEIEAVLLDTSLVGTGLANTLAQLRQDVDVGKVPILLTTTTDTPVARQLIALSRGVQDRLDAIQGEMRRFRSEMDRIGRLEAAEVEAREQELLRLKTPAAQIATELDQIRQRYNRDRVALRQRIPEAAKYEAEEEQLRAQLQKLAARMDVELRVREAALERHLQRVKYDNVQLVHVSLLTQGAALQNALQSVVGQANVALTAEEQKAAAEWAIVLLAGLAEGDPVGYDVRPATEAILRALRMGRLSPQGQQAAIRAATRLSGPGPQTALVAVILDDKRPLEVRLAATRGLIGNFQRQSPLLGAGDVESLRQLAARPKLDPDLKAQVDNILGSLRPTERATGERLRAFYPTPAPASPPAVKKPEDEEKEK